jgi:hypothetical protein
MNDFDNSISTFLLLKVKGILSGGLLKNSRMCREEGFFLKILLIFSLKGFAKTWSDPNGHVPLIF